MINPNQDYYGGVIIEVMMYNTSHIIIIYMKCFKS
jgi:hypothetical protein